MFEWGEGKVGMPQSQFEQPGGSVSMCLDRTGTDGRGLGLRPRRHVDDTHRFAPG